MNPAAWQEGASGSVRPMLARLLGEGFLCWPLVCLTLLTLAWNYNHRVTMAPHRSYDTAARIALLQTIAGPVLPVYGQCASSRNLTEGIYARRGDVPGGYCFHSDCSVAASPTVTAERRFHVRITRPRP